MHVVIVKAGIRIHMNRPENVVIHLRWQQLTLGLGEQPVRAEQAGNVHACKIGGHGDASFWE
jgi:hypothetical protein